jgi:gamma-glutamyltranspeptidase/glutathione hydrolase
LSIDKVIERDGDRIPLRSIHAVTVPGVVDGWSMMLQRFGRQRLAEVLSPAISIAETGFPVTEVFASAWADADTLKALRQDANFSQTFLINGEPPRVGQLFKNADLARSLRLIAAGGRDAFYKGEIARHILETSSKLGGSMRAGDLADYSAEWIDPVSTTYHGWTIYEMPPNTTGIAALEMLNLMEVFPLGEFGHNSARALHTMIEAKKLAFADLQRYDGDPRFAKVPAAGLLAKDYAKDRAALIDPKHANCQVEPGNPPESAGDTTYLSVVDRDGMIVSLIQSNYYGFGTGIVPERSGFVLQNRGRLFSLDPSHPDALAGHKRPLHTIIPAFMTKDSIWIAFGIMGGFNQPQAHAQFVSNIVGHCWRSRLGCHDGQL